jgi:predicted GNAT family acetyltransferase
MALSISTADDDVRAACTAALAADPVRNTILSSVLGNLEDGAGWCAVGPRGELAARSGPSTPVALTDDWRDVSALAAELSALPGVAAVSGPVAAVQELAAVLGRRVAATLRQRLFRCDDLVVPAAAGTTRLATPDDRALLLDWFAAFEREALPVPRAGEWIEAAVDQALTTHRCWLWVAPAGAPVAFARQQAAAFGVSRIGPVYTPPAARRCGYASAVTAHATRDALDDGAVPVLFTDLANPTSNAIYQRMGYRPVSDQVLVRFAD